MKVNENMPSRIAALERDHRGYPIPWNVLRADDGTPLFTINDDRKHWRAIRERICPICGVRLGRWLWFVGGPLSAFDPNGWYLDLPGHVECLEYALATCPYLAAPQYSKRLYVIDPAKLPQGLPILLDETLIPERPVVFVVVTGSGIEYRDRGLLLPYVRPRRPLLEWRFWRHGEKIDEQEARQWISSSLDQI